MTHHSWPWYSGIISVCFPLQHLTLFHRRQERYLTYKLKCLTQGSINHLSTKHLANIRLHCNCLVFWTSPALFSQSTASKAKKEHLSTCDPRLWPMTLTFDLDSVKVNQRVKYIGKRSFHSKLVSWSLTSLFSTNMAISETNGHSL